MKPLLILILLITALATPTGAENVITESSDANAAPQLVVSLVDGSRLLGTTTLKEYSFRSESLGKLIVPLERIASVKFSKDHEPATLTLGNGDHMQGFFALESVELQTLVGRVTIPCNMMRDFVVTAVLTDASLREGLVAYLVSLLYVCRFSTGGSQFFVPSFGPSSACSFFPHGSGAHESTTIPLIAKLCSEVRLHSGFRAGYHSLKQ